MICINIIVKHLKNHKIHDIIIIISTTHTFPFCSYVIYMFPCKFVGHLIYRFSLFILHILLLFAFQPKHKKGDILIFSVCVSMVGYM